jgi:hypothetical protein
VSTSLENFLKLHPHQNINKKIHINRSMKRAHHDELHIKLLCGEFYMQTGIIKWHVTQGTTKGEVNHTHTKVCI